MLHTSILRREESQESLYSQYNIDDEGLREDGTLIVHVREDNLPEGCEDLRYFMDNHWYDVESNEFIFIGLPPNRHAVWSLEKNWWDWDIELVMERYPNCKKQTSFGV